jgi:hypothetical protein
MAAVALLSCLLLSACSTDDAPEPSRSPPESSHDRQLSQNEIDQLQPQVKAFCGDCHAYPEPETFSSDVWRKEVRNGFGFYLESGRTDLSPPPMERVIQYYTQLAPDKLALPDPKPIRDSDKTEWKETIIPFENNGTGSMISSLEKFERAGNWKIAATDMNGGAIVILSLAEGTPKQKVIASCEHPAKATPCDLDEDGHLDFLVAELGTADPADHQLGKVLWLRGNEAGDYSVHELLNNVGRVADVRIGDFNGDHLNDILVAEFGWRKTGSIHLMLRKQTEPDLWSFEDRIIDRRHGTIHLPPVDWNGDGLLDFVALISQEHEVIDLFLNRGEGTFTPQRLYTAPEPAFGSSGIELVDFDGDGDLDVLYTNGDTMDSFHLKPTHGVRWLENTGQPALTPHLIGHLPGCYRALAVDLDNDGDTDVVATAHFPRDIKNLKRERERLIWYEQIEGEFQQHTLAFGEKNQGHFTLAVEDFTGDGKLDLVIGDYGADSRRKGLALWQQTH